MSVAIVPRRRREALVLLLAAAAGALAGCGKSPDSNDRTPPAMSTDRVALERFIHLPDGVRQVQWATGKAAPHGDDWWVAALLDIDPARHDAFLTGAGEPGLFESPPGLALPAALAALQKLPGAQPLQTGGVRVVAPLHGVAPYANSPLLNGHALSLAPGQVLVVLRTR